MNYILYKITNLINGKIYIGVHSTTDLDDGYMGSGELIKSAIAKYGIENFQKEVLENFSSRSEMYLKEKEVVTEEFVARTDTYNLTKGGDGGYEFARKFAQTPQAQKKRQSTRQLKQVGVGSNNTQFGSIWITHPELGNKKIKSDELDTWTKQGWSKGRTVPEGWGDNIRAKLKGKTLVEIHGKEKASQLIKARKTNRKK
jgi:hypothetical protein